MSDGKISQEDSVLIELHKTRIDKSKQEVELRETQMRLFVAGLFKKYHLNDKDQITLDGTIVVAEIEEDQDG